MTRTRFAAALGVALALFLPAAACGDDDNASSATSTTAAGPVPKRIVSLSPTATEMLFAVGAGDQVVAVDDQSNFPASAPKTALSGYEPNIEAIAGYNPDLVVISGDTKNLTSQLKELSIPVLDSPAAKTLDDTYREITEIGVRTGHRAKAGTVVASMKRQVAELIKTVPERSVQPTYFHELDDTLFTVTSKTFIGEIYALAGLKNVADAADADGRSGGYPQLSAEYLVKADPDVIFLADTKCCKQTASTFAARPGFANLKAVKQNHVVGLDDDIASRWGPRVVDLLRQVIEATKAIGGK